MYEFIEWVPAMQQFVVLQKFLADPGNSRHGTLSKYSQWMRTITQAEAAYCRERLLDWTQSDNPSNGGTLSD